LTEEIKTVNQALSESDSKNQILRRCLLWGLVLIVLLALLFLAIKFIEQQGQGDSQSYAAAEALAGRLIESGIIPAQIDYQDPVLTESRTIIITQEINEKVAGEICSKLIYLDRLDPKEPINLVIKTGGGAVDDALLVCDVMAMIEAPVDTWSAGITSFPGTLILAAGTGVRRALPNSLIVVEVQAESSGDGGLPFQDKYWQRMKKFWRLHARFPEDTISLVQEGEYTLTPEEALNCGLIDEISSRQPEHFQEQA